MTRDEITERVEDYKRQLSKQMDDPKSHDLQTVAAWAVGAFMISGLMLGEIAIQLARVNEQLELLTEREGIVQ